MTFDELEVLRYSDGTPDKLACFHKCMMLGHGLIDASGAIQVAELASFFTDSDDKRQELENCIDEVGYVEDCQDYKKVCQCCPKWARFFDNLMMFYDYEIHH